MKQKILLFYFLFFIWGIKSQTISFEDSIKLNISDSYILKQTDVFNSLYFYSQKESSILKYSLGYNNTRYYLQDITPFKKLYIINPLFIVVLDKVTKQMEFFDDKFISTQSKVSLINTKISNFNLIYIKDNRQLVYFDDLTTYSFISYDYRNNKELLYSYSLDANIFKNFEVVDIYCYKQNKYLLLKSILETENNYKALLLDKDNKLTSIEIDKIINYFWHKYQLIIQKENSLLIYDFENEPIRIDIPKSKESLVIINDRLLLQKSDTLYYYKISIND